jgi:hypothetical protein
MTVAATATMLDKALDYARRGWPDFPVYTVIDGRCTCREAACDSPGKHPRVTGWPNQATTDPETIRQWWTRWPGANIGIPTGTASGFFVLDVDLRHDGDETLRELEAQQGPLPPTVEALTGGGGRHIFFRYPGYSVKSSAGVLGPGLDIRGDGGFIVAPDSLHVSGRRYEWEVSSHPDDVPVADAPAWLLDKLRSEATNEHGERFTIPEKIKDGERNTTLYKLARSLKARGLSFEASLAAMLKENSVRCEPPLTDAEVQRIAKHAFEQADRPEYAASGKPGPEALDPLTPLKVLDDAPTPGEVESALRAMVAALTGVDALRRARIRNEALDLLKKKGVPGGAALVGAAMALLGRDGGDTAAKAILLADPEPWPDPVFGAALLSEIEAVIKRYVVLPLEAAVSAALWILFAHSHDAFDVSPLLAITSPTKRCGKSLLEQLVGAMLPRALTTSNISPAALFRAIEAYQPSLLIDEGDAFLSFSEELRGILNSGHTRRGAVVIRCDGDPIEARTYSTWTPKVVALIGQLPDTVTDRSVVIRLQRKGRGEVAARFRSRCMNEITPLCRQAARWANDNLAALREADPAVPDSLNDRAADNWRPLLAVADLAGGTWPKVARQAALTLSGETVQEDSSAGIMLLGDLADIFRKPDHLPTADIIAELMKLEERPWAGWARGKPLTPRHLARLLEPFGVKSKTIRNGDDTVKGYTRIDLAEAFSRYLASASVTPSQPATGVGLQAFSYPSQTPLVTDENSDISMRIQRNVTDVTDRNPENGLGDLSEEVCVL